MSIPKLVDSFLQCREECFPHTNTYPQARTVLNLQASAILDDYKDWKFEIIEQTIRSYIRWRQEMKFARPYDLNSCRNSLQNARGRANLTQKKDPNDKFMAAMSGEVLRWRKRIEGWQKNGFWPQTYGDDMPPNCKHPDARRAMREMGIL